MLRSFQRWAKTDCDVCGCEFQVTRTEPREMERCLCESCEIYERAERESADRIEKLRARIAELEAERAELVKDRERLAEVHAYLLGEAPIAGRWFGDDLPPKTPKFWWRKHLRQAIDATREVADD